LFHHCIALSILAISKARQPHQSRKIRRRARRKKNGMEEEEEERRREKGGNHISRFAK
jgi:hypothetical protein